MIQCRCLGIPTLHATQGPEVSVQMTNHETQDKESQVPFLDLVRIPMFVSVL